MIFISRDLTTDSPFVEVLQQANVKIIGQSLIEIQRLTLSELPACDWLFFYSKNGILHGLSQIDDLKKLPKLAVIGQASADFLFQEFGLTADFIGSGNPQQTAADFSPLSKGQRVVFIQAKHSKQSIQKILGNAIEGQGLVVYDNQPKTDFEIPPADILVFTSPLNVVAYASKYTFSKEQKVVSIGLTTALELQKQGVSDYWIPAAPSEKLLAEECLKILNSK